MTQINDPKGFPPYNVNIVGRHVDVTEGLRQHLLDKLSKVTRFSKRIIEIHISLEVQKIEHRVDIILRGGNHLKIKAHAVAQDMYVAIDKAIARLESQLKRYENRLQEHMAKPIHSVDMQVQVLERQDQELAEANDEIEAANAREIMSNYNFHKVVEKEKRPLSTLTMNEAFMKMELSGDLFRIFRCEEDQKVKVLYRRQKDEQYGLIEVD